MLYNHSTLEKEKLKEIIKSPQIIMSKTSVCKRLHLELSALELCPLTHCLHCI